MATPSPAELAASLAHLGGPFVVGTACSTFLLGVTLSQTYNYFLHFGSDRRAFRHGVISLAVLDTCHTAVSWFTLYFWFVKHYGDPSEMLVSPWSFGIQPAICGIAATICHCFYAHRIWVLGKRAGLLPVVVIAGSIFQLAWSLACTAEIFVLKEFSRFQEFTYGVAGWLGGAALVDMIITGTLVYILMGSKGEIPTTNGIIDKVMKLTVETNGLTFVCAVFDVVLFASRSDASHVAPNLLLPKLYANSFLVSLNSRRALPNLAAAAASCDAQFQSNSSNNYLKSALPASARSFALGGGRCKTTNDEGIQLEFARRSNSGGVHVRTTASIHTSPFLANTGEPAVHGYPERHPQLPRRVSALRLGQPNDGAASAGYAGDRVKREGLPEKGEFSTNYPMPSEQSFV